MKKLNKKGFTIVELVIVIAVIAILAAVLIPTFATVIKKANVNAALQGGRNAYTAIMAETTANFNVGSVDANNVVKDNTTDTNTIIDLDDYIKDIKTVEFTASPITITIKTNSGATVTITASGVTAD